MNKNCSKNHIKGGTWGNELGNQTNNRLQKLNRDIKANGQRDLQKIGENNERLQKWSLRAAKGINLIKNVYTGPKNVMNSVIKRAQARRRDMLNKREGRGGGKKKKKSSGQYTKKEKKKINGVIKVIYTKKKSRKLYVKSKGKMINLIKYKKILSNKKK